MTADVSPPPEQLRSVLQRINLHRKPITASDEAGAPARPALAPLPRRTVRTPTHTQVPNEVLDQWLPLLSGPELKCLLLIIRRTFGWHQPADAMSLAQIEASLHAPKGTTRAEDNSLSRSTIIRALTSLEERGFIFRDRQQSKERGHEATVFALRLEEDP